MYPAPPNKPSRRAVLKSIGATTTLAASGLLPTTIHAATAPSANNKLRVGLIGAGNRAKWLTVSPIHPWNLLTIWIGNPVAQPRHSPADRDIQNRDGGGRHILHR